MSDLEQLVEILNGDQSSGWVRLDIARHAPIVADGVVRPVGVDYFDGPERDANVTKSGIAAVWVRDGQGDVDTYFLGSGSERGTFQMFAQGAVEERVLENLSLQGRPLILVGEPLTLKDL